MPETLCGWDDVQDGARGFELLIAHGPTLLVDIGFDQNYANIGVPVPGRAGVHALVDTGAFESCIDSQLAQELNLPIVDRRQVCGSNGTHEVNLHLAQVHIPALNRTIYGLFSAVHLSAGGQMHQALIGRTFLRHCHMVYNGVTGLVSISCE